MEAILKELNSVPGVVGSMLCDGEGRLVAEAFPPQFAGPEAHEAAQALADCSADMRKVAGTIDLVELHYGQSRVLVRQFGSNTLLLLCEKSVNPRALLAAASEVLRGREETDQASPAPSKTLPLRTGRYSIEPEPGEPSDVMPSRAILDRKSLLLGAFGAAALMAIVLSAFWLGRGSRGALAPAADARPGAAGPQVILRIGGARATTEELAPALAEAYLNSLRFTDVKVKKLGSHQFTVQGMKEGTPLAVTVRGTTTPKGLEELQAGAVDLTTTTRRVKAEEEQKMVALGSMTSPANEHVVGLSGVAVIVNPVNSVPQLNAEQLKGIFSGAVKDWSTTSGAKGSWPIHVFATADGMGTTDVFRSNVLGSASFTPDAKRLYGYQEINDLVAGDPGGIGIVTLPFVRGTRSVAVGETNTAPLLPTAFTVATEDYFLTHRLYIYTPQASDNPHVLRFVQFALGPEGQAVVKKTGYVELSVAAERREAPARAPARYLRLTSGARRLSSTFRFDINSSSFDTRALIDLERVTKYLLDNRLNGSAVRVLGFTDTQGGAAYNARLSLVRADQVVRAFAQRGIAGVVAAGIGEEMPLASNLTNEGRQKNRRVEVWVTQ